MTENQTTRLSPALIQRHLHGVHYPASRDDLVSHARRECEGGSYPQGECERVIQLLNQLPGGEYQRPVDVSKAFGEVARGYLQNASYPARRDDLVTSARKEGADQVVLDMIVIIPDEQYEDVDAVIVQVIGDD